MAIAARRAARPPKVPVDTLAAAPVVGAAVVLAALGELLVVVAEWDSDVVLEAEECAELVLEALSEEEPVDTDASGVLDVVVVRVVDEPAT